MLCILCTYISIYYNKLILTVKILRRAAVIIAGLFYLSLNKKICNIYFTKKFVNCRFSHITQRWWERKEFPLWSLMIIWRTATRRVKTDARVSRNSCRSCQNIRGKKRNPGRRCMVCHYCPSRASVKWNFLWRLTPTGRICVECGEWTDPNSVGKHHSGLLHTHTHTRARAHIHIYLHAHTAHTEINEDEREW